MHSLLIKTFFMALLVMPFVISQVMAQEGGKPDSCVDASGASHPVVSAERS